MHHSKSDDINGDILIDVKEKVGWMLISSFVLQEENIMSCKVCHAPFHKPCFSRYNSCPACPKDQSKSLGLAGEFQQSQMEGLSEDHKDALPLLGGQDVMTSPSSIGETDLQSQFVTDKQSHNYRNWPSFYHLLPKKRLW